MAGLLSDFINQTTSVPGLLDYKFRKDTFGMRHDNSSPKGYGFLGILPQGQGGYATEISIGVDFGLGPMEIPTLVPTLTKEERDFLLNMPENAEMPETIIDKAVGHAVDRLMSGRLPFKD